ncbi:ATP-binding protein [Streptomyces rubiginosohelvolus]|uniref:ATP-binding protein n=1 Tax=Streptomyces rubiginosohelvolus TaxID=67362 RepID=UPI0035DB4978
MTLTVLGRQGPQVQDGRGRSAPQVRLFEVCIARVTPAGQQPLAVADQRRPGQLRRVNCALLGYWGLRPCIKTAELLLTELATNAFQHGEGDVTVTWRLDTVHLSILVRDGSTTRPALRTADSASERGRGLCLVEALADQWGVSDDGTTVHCSLALPDAASA